MVTGPRESRRAFLKAAGVAAATLSTPIGQGAERMGPITAVTLIHGRPGQEEDLKQHLLALAPPTRAEAGCLRYDLYQSPEQRHEFMRFEVWKSQDDLELHKKTPPLRASFEKRQREGWTTQIMVFGRVPEDETPGRP